MSDISFNEQERLARQLESIEGRFEELSIRITLPEVISDSTLFAKLMREHADMQELNEVAVNYRRLREEIAAANELLVDPDMREMAQEELAVLNQQLEERRRRRASPCCPRTRTTTKTPSLKCARVQAATKPVCSARNCCACTSTMPPRRAGNLNSLRTAPRSWAASRKASP